MAERELSNERVDVGILQERGIRMPPALRASGFIQPTLKSCLNK